MLSPLKKLISGFEFPGSLQPIMMLLGLATGALETHQKVQTVQGAYLRFAKKHNKIDCNANPGNPNP